MIHQNFQAVFCSMLFPENRQPAHPGELLLKKYLEPMGITQVEFVRHLGGTWTQGKLSEIIHGRRGITPRTALDFSMAFGTTPMFWLNLQQQYDLWEAAQHLREILPIRMAT